MKSWWKEAIVYQIYPRSFKDSNADGIGDLRGIISKLDYIKSLGIDVVWLNPIFSSPNDDNGYDISDYQDILREYGTMADFDALIQAMHAAGIRLLLDLVVNHSSDEHAWFKQSKSARNNPYRHYYHWWPKEKGEPPARFSFFDLENNAWKYDEHTESYYLHYFSVKQPDLNWENPAVRKQVYQMMRFWLDKGVDGFRMDVIPFISKDTRFPPLPFEYHGDYISYYAKGPYLHAYLREMNDQVLSQYDVMTVGEGVGVHTADALDFVDPDRHELNMFFHFDGTGLGASYGKIPQLDPAGYRLTEFKEVYTRWDQVFKDKGWGSVYLGNHDRPRAVSRWGNEKEPFRSASAKLLLTFLLTMRATPYVYQGDELGMTNVRFDSIEAYRDIETINKYTALTGSGATPDEIEAFIMGQKDLARDNARTPFQWDRSKNAGFTEGQPWLSVNPNHLAINAADQEDHPDSILNYFRKMVRIRKENPVLVYGEYALQFAEATDLYAYTREMDNNCLLVLLNFSDAEITPSLVDFNISEKPIISNYPEQSLVKQPANIALRPYEAAVYRINRS